MSAPRLTKKTINAIQVQERREMRRKFDASAFLRTTGTRYRSMAKRAADFGIPHLPFTLEQLREHVKPFIGTQCKCGAKITVKSMALDHNEPVSRGGSWDLFNVVVPCRKCNLRKGVLLPHEYIELSKFVATLTAESREDIWRRLVIGGKFTFGK
jgi:5-methylcytosine-specific restriction endonuclease McrA